MSKKHLLILLICALCVAIISTALFVGCKKETAVDIVVNDIVETYSGNPVTVSCNTSDGAYSFDGTNTDGVWSVSYVDEKGDYVSECVNAGTYTATITFQAKNYKTATATCTITIDKAVPTVRSWPVLKNETYTVTYGETLDNSELNPTTADSTSRVVGVFGEAVRGTFSWANTTVSVKTEKYDVIFTPAGQGSGDKSSFYNNYTTVSMKATTSSGLPVTVLPATPVCVTVPQATSLNSGDSLMDSKLTKAVFGIPKANGEYTTVRGTCVWGTVTENGEVVVYDYTTAPLVQVKNQNNYTVVFIPQDTDNFTVSAPVNVPLTVAPFTPTFNDSSIYVIPTASAISYGKPLSESILSSALGTAKGQSDQVPGTFRWENLDIVPEGDPVTRLATYNAVFVPDDSVEYSSNVLVKIQVEVLPAELTIILPSASGIEYGESLSNSQFISDPERPSGVYYDYYNASTQSYETRSVEGIFVWDDQNEVPESYPSAGELDTYNCSAKFILSDTQFAYRFDEADFDVVIKVKVNKLPIQAIDESKFSAINGVVFGTRLADVELPQYTARAYATDEFGNPDDSGELVYGILTWVNPDEYPGLSSDNRYQAVFTPSEEYSKYKSAYVYIQVNVVSASIDADNSTLPVVSVRIETGETLKDSDIDASNARMLISGYVDENGVHIPIQGRFTWTYSGVVMPTKMNYEVSFIPDDTSLVNVFNFTLTVSIVSESSCFMFNYDDTLMTATIIGLASHTDCIGGHSNLVINDTVKHDGKEYTIVAIDFNDSLGKGAFEGMAVIRSITLPSTLIYIGANSFAGCSNISEIVIPAGVTTIGNHAFDGCTNLSIIDNQSSVLETVGEFAFKDCVSLVKLALPNSVMSIGIGAFVNCGSLTDLSVGAGNANYYLYEGVLFQRESGTNGQQYILHTYLAVNSVASYKIPDSVWAIGAYAFAYNDNILQQVVCNSVYRIGEYAFEGCKFLKYVYVLNENNFDGSNWTTALADINENGVTVFAETDQGALKEACDLLGHTFKLWTASNYLNFVYNDGEKTAEINGFIQDLAEESKNTVTSLVIPATVTRNGVTYTVKSVGGFGRNTVITEVIIPETVETVKSYAFLSCTNLSEVVFFEGLLSIEANAFGDTSIRTLYIPSSVLEIGNNAFYRNAYLTGVTFAGDCSLGSDVFKDCNKDLLVYGPETTDSGYSMLYIYFSDPSINIPFCLYTPASCLLYSISTGSNPYVIIQGLRNHTCSGHTNIRIPELIDGYTVKVIADGAFQNKPVQSVTIPKTVTSIGSNVFAGCSELNQIIIAEGNTRYSFVSTTDDNGNMKSGALLNGDGTVLIGYLSVSTASSYTVPQTVKEIKNNAFEGATALESVVIGENVETLGVNLFKGCTSLVSVTFDNNKYYTFENGAIYNITKSKLLSYIGKEKRLVIPSTVTDIGESAFEGVDGLESVIFTDRKSVV